MGTHCPGIEPTNSAECAPWQISLRPQLWSIVRQNRSRQHCTSITRGVSIRRDISAAKYWYWCREKITVGMSTSNQWTGRECSYCALSDFNQIFSIGFLSNSLVFTPHSSIYPVCRVDRLEACFIFSSLSFLVTDPSLITFHPPWLYYGTLYHVMYA